MAIGGMGPMVMAVMWSITFLIMVMVALRLYTRAYVVRSIGADDHMFACTGLFLLLYTSFTHVAANYGFGQEMMTLSLEDSSTAIFWEMVGQTFAVLGMAMAKLSLGLFLLRLVVKGWHRVIIWAVMIYLSAISICTAVVFWTQCVPVAKIWDRVRVDGVCNFEVTPVAMVLGVSCILADFFFAGFPWVFIWQLNMPRREKITIAGSMSLGVIAGVCGIVRTLEVSDLSGERYLTDTVPLIIWSAAELAITLVCMVVPIFRPLWRRIRGVSAGRSQRYEKKSEGADRSDLPGGSELQTIGGKSSRSNKRQQQDSVLNTVTDLESAPAKLGLTTGTKTYAVRQESLAGSEEEILGGDYRTGSGGVRIKDEVRVERSGVL